MGYHEIEMRKIIIFCSLFAFQTLASPERKRLRQELLNEYNKHIHPIEDHDLPVNIEIDRVTLIHLDLEPSTSVFTVDIWLSLGWNDPKLAWIPMDYGGIKEMHFNSADLWIPDIQIYNNADEANINHYGMTHCLVQSNGDVIWVPPAHLKAFCTMDITNWPFDTHICKLIIGSWTSNGNQINLTLEEEEVHIIDDFTYFNRQWEIIGPVKGTLQSTFYECCPEPYQDVTYVFKLQRRSIGLAVMVRLPISVVMFMVAFSFLMKQSEVKILMNVLCILICIMYLIYLAWTLPLSRFGVPRVVVLYTIVTVLTAIAILLQIISSNLVLEERLYSPPRLILTFFADYANSLLHLDIQKTQVIQSRRQVEQINNQEDDTKITFADLKEVFAKEWILIAAGLEKVGFCVYTFLFVILTFTIL